MTYSYLSEWEGLKKAQRFVKLGFFLWIPFGFLFVVIASKLGVDAEVSMFLALAIWVVSVQIAINKIKKFRCPRCKNEFFRKNFFLRNFCADKCYHCDLSLWEPSGQSPVEYIHDQETGDPIIGTQWMLPPK